MALCLEDAAVFGSLFSHIQSRPQIGRFFSAFLELRRPRCESLRLKGLRETHYLTLPKGPQQAERDEPLRHTYISSTWDDVSDIQFRQEWEGLQDVFGYDAYDAADSWWVEWGFLEQRANADISELHYVTETRTTSVEDQKV